MKKSFLFTMVALVAFNLQLMAEPVTLEKAQDQAREFLQSIGAQVDALYLVDAPKKVTSSREEAVYYYLFNFGADKGFVIISGDDRTQPVLGYSEEGNVTPEDIAHTMQPILNTYKGEMDKLEMMQNEVIGGPAPRHVQSPSLSPVSPLVSSHWSQVAPYNNSTPTIGGVHCQAGCLAIAAAQIVYSFRSRMPAKLAVTIPAYTTTKKKLAMSSVPKGTSFYWDRMVDDLTNATSTQISAVANLILYVGKALASDYNADATSAKLGNFPTALTNYFGFSSDVRQVKRTSYTLSRWKEILVNELCANRPILIYGENPSLGGHAFIYDGFDGGDMFHVNWGHGRGDGYFLLSTLTLVQPDDEEAFLSAEYSFTKNMIAYIGLQPNLGYVEGEEDVTLYSTINSVSSSTNTATVSYGNYSGSKHSYSGGLGYLDENLHVKLLKKWTNGHVAMANNSTVSGVAYPLTVKDFTANGLAKGTYKLYPVYKVDADEDWHLCDQSSTLSYVKAVYSTSGLSISKAANSPSFTVGTLKFPGCHGKGYMQYVDFEVTNNGDEGVGTLYLYASTSSTIPSSYSSKVDVALYKGESVNVQMYFKPSYASKYNVWITDGTNVLKSGTITTVSATSGTAYPLVASSTNISTLISGTKKFYGTTLKGNVVIKNNGSQPYAGYVSVYLYKSSKSTGHRYTKWLELKAGGTESIEFCFEGLTLGASYGVFTLYEDTRQFVKPYLNNVIPTAGVIFHKVNGDISATGSASSITVPSDAVAVDLTGVTSGISKVVANSNPNTFYYMGESETAPTGLSGKNVVKGSTASSVTLTDGYDMYVPKAFTAKNITFSRKPSIGTGGSGGWTSIVVPFDVNKVVVDNVEIDWFKSDTDYGKNFWVKEFQGISGDNTVCFGYAQEMKANHPYIMAVPNNKWGEQFNLVGKKMTFHGTNALLDKDPSVLVGSEWMYFRGTYATINTTNTYVLNSTGTKFSFGANKVKPFCAYFVTRDLDTYGVGDLNIGTFEDETDGIMRLFDDDADMTVDVYNISGVKVGTAEVRGGKADLGNLPKGIYIVNGKKVVK